MCNKHVFSFLFSRPLLRRSSDGGLGTSENLATQNFDPLNTSHLHNSTAGAPTGTHLSTSSTSGMMNAGGTGGAGHRRAHSSMSGRYPRSWHPSPFGSEDEASATEEPQFYKEEKKNRIKMEIARRRQQIEENACLHDELTRLAKLRETAELSDRLNVNTYGASPMSPAMAAAAAAAGVAGATTSNSAAGTGTSVLKSVDEILRSNGALHVPSSSVHGVAGTVADLYNNHVPGSIHGIGSSTAVNSLTAGYGAGLGSSVATHPTTAAAAAHGAITGSSTVGYGDHRVMDFSPINSDMIDHRSHFRSSSADPTLNYGIGNSYMTTSAGVGPIATAGADPYGGGGKYSKYGTMTGSSSLYRKY